MPSKEDLVILQLDYTRNSHNLVLKYPVEGTRRSHLTAMKERAAGRARFNETIDSKGRQCVVIAGLPIEEIERPNDRETTSRTIRLNDDLTAAVLHEILELGYLAGRYIEYIPLKMTWAQWETVCQLPIRDAEKSRVRNNPMPLFIYSSRILTCKLAVPREKGKRRRRKRKRRT